MAINTIERYIEARYAKWLNQTRRKCAWYGVNPCNAEDLLQDTLFVLFKKRKEDAIVEMIAIKVHDTYSLLDIFISRTRDNRLMNLKKHCGVVSRVMLDVDTTNYNTEIQ